MGGYLMPKIQMKWKTSSRSLLKILYELRRLSFPGGNWWHMDSTNGGSLNDLGITF